ncbi:MAG: gliding motility-associated C-terminal domain-containing protein [Flavobacteriales bacterium]|nr:gliding motility-associated C-terminal domain-containing protein [Flavobacteriales bacterium]
MKRIVYILFLLFALPALATHNRAGEITFTHVTGLTYEITVTTYTKDSSPADRPKLEISWGDSSPLDSIDRISNIYLGNDIRKNVYVAQHTYPGASPIPYTISVEDPNRNQGVLNIPNSVNVVFYLETKLFINPFMGVNNSPQLLNPPIDNACVGSIYVHNPGAVDTDGDSLYYSLSQSLKEGGQNIPNYQFPAASNFITINNFTGDLIWDSPIAQGEYNVAILIEEFRDGYKIGSLLRDMQITVVPACDPPPVITGMTDTCVVAGDILDIDYNITGSYPVTVTSTGIPYTITNSALFQQTTAPATVTTANFYWETQCNHVRQSSYFVSIKAIDAGPYNLADFHTSTISVIGPKPKNLTTNVQTNYINLSWNKSSCSQVIAYKIYRRLGPSGWSPGPCETGIPASAGYQLIATNNSINDTTFSDNNNGLGLVSGEDYCYRIVACYPDGAESIASDEVCDQLLKDVPVITHVSVNTTSATTGSIFVGWSKPTEHNVVQFPGPYRYLIYRGQQNSSNMQLIDSTATINDTTYIDTLLNTQNFQYFYRIDIYDLSAGRELMGSSAVASSVFLQLIPSDNRITLVWNEFTPWTNSQHVIYKFNNGTLTFDSLDITSANNYTDTGLVNLQTYCYKVKSIGGYTAPGTVSPLINYSQETCGQPEDNIAPCPPELCIQTDCKTQSNLLHWVNFNPGCADDVLGFNIYKKDSVNGEYILVSNIPNGSDSTYLHSNLPSIVGCYVITGLDSVGNESLYSDSVCIDNPNGACEGNSGCVYNADETVAETECYKYRLPNVFTPGTDGYNDLFRPFPYSFVKSVNMQIFNRWGSIVYETTDPDILWDGYNQENGKACSDGTYYYVCTVNEYCLSGVQPRIIKGYISLISNKGASKP